MKSLAAGVIKKSGIEYDDALQVGLIAAWRACETYKEGNDTKVSTWVTICVKREYISAIKRWYKTIAQDSDIEGLVDVLVGDESVGRDDAIWLRQIYDEVSPGARVVITCILNGVGVNSEGFIRIDRLANKLNIDAFDVALAVLEVRQCLIEAQ